jgi:hypothetical protein
MHTTPQQGALFHAKRKLKAAMVSKVMQRARWIAHSSFCSSRIAPRRLTMASSLGKMPTTLVLRLTSPLSRSETVGGIGSRPMHVGEDVGLGLVHEGRELGPELVGDLAPLGLSGVGVVLREGGGREGRDHAPAAFTGMGKGVVHRMNAAALPDAGRRSDSSRWRHHLGSQGIEKGVLQR